MNSKFDVSDLGGFSPVDFGSPAVLSLSQNAAQETEPKALPSRTRKRSATAAASTASDTSVVSAEDFKVFVQPTVLGRRVDIATRRVFPTVERLPVEPYCFTLTMEPMDGSKKKRIKKDDRPVVNAPSSSSTTSSSSTSASASASTPTPTPTPTSTPSTPVTSSVAEKRLKVTANGGVKETALVRLSSGKIVRVPMDILRQHQAQAVVNKTVEPKSNTTNRPVTAPSVPVSSAVAQARLSEVLQRLTPTPPAAPSGLLTSPPPLIPTAPAAEQHQPRLVKIRANQGPPVVNPPRPNGISNTPARTSLTTSCSPAKLSDRLSALVPVASDSSGQARMANPPTDLVINGSVVKLRYINRQVPQQIIQLPAGHQFQPGQQIVVNGQRLSTVLSSVATSGQQVLQSSPNKYIILSTPTHQQGQQVLSNVWKKSAKPEK